ncbi:MAG: peptidase MA family metallohydrolase [Candidatus Omnitrophota bacterium]
MKKILFAYLVFITLIPNIYALEWKNLKSTHFIIYYKKADMVFLNRIKDYLENYYQKITDDIGFTRYNNFWIWENRAKVYIYDTKKEYIMDTNQPEWSFGSADVKNKIIITYYGVSEKEFFDKVVLHELVHIIFREFVGFSGNIYLWLDEGVAEFFSKDYSFMLPLIRSAIKENKFIPISSLPQASLDGLNEEQVKLFYLESGAIIYYLINNYGKANFVGFCRALRDGRSLDNALYSNYPIKNIDELNKRVINYFSNG